MNELRKYIDNRSKNILLTDQGLSLILSLIKSAAIDLVKPIIAAFEDP